MTGRGFPDEPAIARQLPQVHALTMNDNAHAASEWLAGAHPVSDTARLGWLRNETVLLPVGSRWDAVKFPAAHVHRLAGTDDPGHVRALLALFDIGGPVIVARHAWTYYVLVPPRTDREWASPHAECLGGDAFLGVPPAARIEGPDDHWLIPPDGTGEDLNSPDAARALAEALAARHGAEQAG